MPKETFTRYDTADYLRDEESILAYLDAVMEEGADDPALITHALGNIARARNMSQLARDTGLTREGLYKALSDTGNPSFATIVKVAQALGLRLTFQAPSASSSR
jgi:probable addiction module antidote protein